MKNVRFINRCYEEWVAWTNLVEQYDEEFSRALETADKDVLTYYRGQMSNAIQCRHYWQRQYNDELLEELKNNDIDIEEFYELFDAIN